MIFILNKPIVIFYIKMKVYALKRCLKKMSTIIVAHTVGTTQPAPEYHFDRIISLRSDEQQNQFC